MTTLTIDQAATKAASAAFDKFIRKVTTVRQVDQADEYSQTALLHRTMRKYQLKGRTSRLIRTLGKKGFQQVLTDDGLTVYSKEVQQPHSRHVAQVYVYPDRLVCKCYSGAPAALV